MSSKPPLPSSSFTVFGDEPVPSILVDSVMIRQDCKTQQWSHGPFPVEDVSLHSAARVVTQFIRKSSGVLDYKHTAPVGPIPAVVSHSSSRASTKATVSTMGPVATDDRVICEVSTPRKVQEGVVGSVGGGKDSKGLGMSAMAYAFDDNWPLTVWGLLTAWVLTAAFFLLALWRGSMMMPKPTPQWFNILLIVVVVLKIVQTTTWLFFVPTLQSYKVRPLLVAILILTSLPVEILVQFHNPFADPILTLVLFYVQAAAWTFLFAVYLERRRDDQQPQPPAKKQQPQQQQQQQPGVDGSTDVVSSSVTASKLKTSMFGTSWRDEATEKEFVFRSCQRWCCVPFGGRLSPLAYRRLVFFGRHFLVSVDLFSDVTVGLGLIKISWRPTTPTPWVFFNAGLTIFVLAMVEVNSILVEIFVRQPSATKALLNLFTACLEVPILILTVMYCPQWNLPMTIVSGVLTLLGILYKAGTCVYAFKKPGAPAQKTTYSHETA
ncbi:unnamed protein product [Vitrella brassicaformis CCMP3155]|uniref:Uncharacterized protein n=2 Tax=Vitrella brassicaformis TaxID=1169539 RepID=A0A0G4F8U7_VITBC|nr:unnamed protein product [Vitrella brassicaformis CCMP3155]|mmetsp:Transcript_16678/g.40025  ORF Transcript_16678/g.40025 Transcript_16678/m.40025 type:complete len:492 (+) Transcript_16678:223-1698(+)|eukprot:CEM09129.1 unnamed protein product [Vitrella brassicaformis CCMP3155]